MWDRVVGEDALRESQLPCADMWGSPVSGRACTWLKREALRAGLPAGPVRERGEGRPSGPAGKERERERGWAGQRGFGLGFRFTVFPISIPFSFSNSLKSN